MRLNAILRSILCQSMILLMLCSNLGEICDFFLILECKSLLVIYVYSVLNTRVNSDPCVYFGLTRI